MSEQEQKKSHKTLKIVGIVILVLIVFSVIASAGETNQTATNTQNAASNNETTQPVVEEPKKMDMKTFYSQVQTGMTKEQVTKLAGQEPDDCSEVEMAGMDKYENCSWNGGFTDGTYVSVGFSGNKVQDKSKFNF